MWSREFLIKVLQKRGDGIKGVINTYFYEIKEKCVLKFKISNGALSSWKK